VSVLVTGGAGFIGSHLVDRLIVEGHHVVCLDNFDPYYDPAIKRRNIAHNLRNENFELVEADVRDKGKLEGVFKNQKIEQVVHLAAKVGVRPSVQDPFIYEDVNIGGTINLLELSRDFNIKNFIFGSSSSVYGISEKVPFSEEDVCQPISPYAVSKRACELYCHAYHHLFDIPVRCLRFFTVYGPRQRPEMAIHKFTRLIDEGKEIEVYGDGSSKRDYTYIDDIIKGIMAALDKKFDFQIINLGNSETVELKRLISLIEENLGEKAKIKWLQAQPGDVPITYADISKAKGLLNYHPKIGIEEGIRKFVEWYMECRKELRRI
jgi:UDP-glucuronate 4-epimerase